jgi:hypothetical protein
MQYDNHTHEDLEQSTANSERKKKETSRESYQPSCEIIVSESVKQFLEVTVSNPQSRSDPVIITCCHGNSAKPPPHFWVVAQ